MRNVVVVGSQWGDEGKGKIVDWLSSVADVVVRFQGGHNAGHTLVIDKKIFKLRLLPSGIVREGKISILGNGVVIDPWALLSEIEEISKKGIKVSPDNFMISESASLILPFHKEMDEIREDTAGKEKIGTTRRGIGPCYEDKVGRRSIRVMDLRSESNLDSRLENVLLHHNAIRKGLNKKIYEKNELKKELLKISTEILKFAQPVWLKLDQFNNDRKKILFEGAQGILLDVDHGTYPYVTSSSTTAGGVSTGLGIGPKFIDKIIGITKAYTTRVGEGPFPTELHDESGSMLAEKGNEFGATTGRPRRCGWLDLVLLKKAIFINSVTDLCITKLDVLDEMQEIKVCTNYHNGVPVYKNFEGWLAKTEGITTFSDLPEKASLYIQFVEEFVECSASIISTGPSRNQTILR